MLKETYLFLGDSITDAGHLWDEDVRALGNGFVRKIGETPTFANKTLINKGQDGFTSKRLLELLKRKLFLDQLIPNELFSNMRSVSVPLLKERLCEISSQNNISSHTDTLPVDVRDMSSQSMLQAVTILIGVNDLPLQYYTDNTWLEREFLPNMNEILQLIRSRFSGRILLLEPFLFSKPAELAVLKTSLYREWEILKLLAEKWNAEYVPLQSRLDQAVEQYGYEAVTEDGIHLTDYGNCILAETWLTACQGE